MSKRVKGSSRFPTVVAFLHSQVLEIDRYNFHTAPAIVFAAIWQKFASSVYICNFESIRTLDVPSVLERHAAANIASAKFESDLKIYVGAARYLPRANI